MKKSHYHIFPAVCAVISFIGFLLISYMIITGSVLPFVLCFIFFIPAIVFGIISFLGYAGSLSRIASNILTGVLIPVLGLASLFALLILIFVASTTDCTDARQYGRVYGMYEEHLSVFPENIPGSATGVDFVYQPQFLQGGGKVYLKYSDDAEDLVNICSKLSDVAVWYGDGDALGSWDELPEYFDGYGLLYESSVPRDYTLYLIDFENACDPGEDAYGWWNHGSYTVVAVSPDTGEICYKMAWW